MTDWLIRLDTMADQARKEIAQMAAFARRSTGQSFRRAAERLAKWQPK